MRLDHAPECRYQTSAAPQIIRGQQIVFIRRCVGNTGRPDNQLTEVDVVKLGSASPKLWRPYYLPDLTNSLAVAPTGERGIIADGAANPRFHWLDAKRLSGPIPLHWPWAQSASWSATGDAIAAIGIASNTNRRGPALLGLPNEVALLDREAQLKRVLLPSVHDAYTPAWSPNGRTLAISAQPAGKPRGIYLINVRTAKTKLLVKGRYFSEIAWTAPDQIAAAYGTFERNSRPGVHLYAFSDRDLP